MMFLSRLSTPIPLVERNHSSPLKFRIKSSMTSTSTNSGEILKKSNSKTVAMSGFESRVSLILALASQTSLVSQRLLMELATETAKYVFPNTRFQTTTLEEAFMSVPNLETVDFKVLYRNPQYEIRQVESYFIAETTMPGKNGFEFVGASQSFNTLAEYLFGKNTGEKQMEMTTPVFTRKMEPKGEKMDMTTPVITTRVKDDEKWTMSFVLPSKYGANLPLPKNSSVTIREVPNKIIAVVAFSGFVTGEEVQSRESALKTMLKNDSEFRAKENVPVEIAQYNPPFTPPFQRRNEIALEVERRQT